MFFRQLFDPDSSTYTYVIADDVSHEAVVIDPVAEQAERDVRLLQQHGLKLKYSLETHVHADHVTGAHALKKATGAETVIAFDCNAPGYDRQLRDGDVILFGQEEITIIATPGHTPGSVCYLWRDRLFTGDTLLIGGCGRTDFQNGSAEALYRSVTERLFTLDEHTLIYPAHDYKGRRVSSIGEEKLLNQRFAGKSREEFISLMSNLNLPMPKRIQEAVPANRIAGAGAPAAETIATEWAEIEGRVRVQNVSAKQLAERLHSHPIHLIDVRTPGEFAERRVEGARNLPLDQLNPAALLAELGADAPIYCICQTGTRSQLAVTKLREGGFRRVVHVDGGTNAWAAAGLPVQRG
jgi:glyoxylase-like metal-dependent hydrolase (beta-lactamase superfamily II)/rhodanese-related sulfurtransferase